MAEEAERKRGRLGLFPQAAPLIWASVADEVSELSSQHRAYDLVLIKIFAAKLEPDVFERGRLAGACELEGALK
jgi:hypothetical protein